MRESLDAVNPESFSNKPGGCSIIGNGYVSISDETMQALDDMYSLLGDISTISGNMEKVAKN